MAQANNFSFSRFKQEMQNAARGNQFRLDIFAPLEIRGFIDSASIIEEAMPFKVKTTNLPSLTLDEIELNFRGRKCKIAGDRTLEPFNATIYATNGLPERKFFETWQDSIVGIKDACRNPDADVNYFADATLYQLDQNGNEQTSYQLEGIWPQSIGEISFDFEAGEVLQFDVTFAINNISSEGIR